MQDFVGHLENDFDSNTALTVIFEFQKTINTGIDNDLYSNSEIEAIQDFFRSIDAVLGIFDFNIFDTSDEVPEEIQTLAEERIQAKTEKNWEKADEIRDILEGK